MNRPERHCGLYIKKINDRLAAMSNRFLQAHQLTHMQSHLLLMMACEGRESYTLKELEARFGVAQSTMAGLVSRLEHKGLLESLGDAQDQRIKRVRLTDAGREHCAMAGEGIVRTEEMIASALTPEESLQLQRLLQRVYESIASACEKG